MGLHRAGYQVVGVDIEPQPRYPFPFIQADVMQIDFRRFDLAWASPPCQQFCRLRTREDLSGYPDLIEPIRAKLIASCGPEAMGIDWMSGNEMSEAIPPAYAEYIGRAAIAHSKPKLVEAAE